MGVLGWFPRAWIEGYRVHEFERLKDLSEREGSFAYGRRGAYFICLNNLFLDYQAEIKNDGVVAVGEGVNALQVYVDVEYAALSDINGENLRDVMVHEELVLGERLNVGSYNSVVLESPILYHRKGLEMMVLLGFNKNRENGSEDVLCEPY